MAAGAATFRSPPIIHNIRTRPTSRLPANAATITSGRMVRSILNSPIFGSETGRDAGRDHFEEDRGPVVKPQDQCAEQKGCAEACGGDGNDRAGPARR